MPSVIKPRPANFKHPNSGKPTDKPDSNIIEFPRTTPAAGDGEDLPEFRQAMESIRGILRLPEDLQRALFFRWVLRGRSPAEAYKRPLRPRAAGAAVSEDDSFIQKALAKAFRAVENAKARNNELNRQAFGLGQLIGDDLTRADAEDCLEKAAKAANLDKDDGGIKGVRDTIKSGLDAGIENPRDLSKIKLPCRWNRCKPIKGTLAETYLNKRGIDLAEWPGTLGFASIYNTESDSNLPALIGLATMQPGGEQIAFQRIYLKDDGSWKAALAKPKKARGAYRGAAIWFGRPGPRLVISEGIEDALSCLAAGETFACAAIGGSNVANVTPPECVREIIVFGDRADEGKGPGIDSTGKQALKKGAPRWVEAGIAVRTALAPVPLKDASDLLMKGGGIAAVQAALGEAVPYVLKNGRDKEGESGPHSELVRTAAPGAAPNERAPAFSDQDLALRFVREHAHDLRYLKAWDKWLHYDGTRWRKDDTLFAFDLARMMCLKIAGKVSDKDMQHRLASAGAVASTVRLASANRQFASEAEQWDADPWLLCTPGGTVDLRRTKSNGNLRPHCAEDYLTKMTAVAPDPNCPTPIWSKFLKRVTGEDATGGTDFQDYLQRVCGYMASGSIKEHAMFFLYGTGANGKSVFIETIAGILGDYHRVAASETFFDTGGERHPTDLAGLQGARAVTLTETEEGGKWNESKIKKLTGGDTITARFMRQDYFDYKPQFKPLVAGNHRPSLRSIDEAIKRRMHLIPFQVTIPEDERDKELSEKLKAEWPGILAWIIRGCLDWQEEGLKPPKAVTDATQEYFAAEDHLGNWVGERCECHPSGFESSENLFGDWRAWAGKSGVAAGTKTKLTQKLKERGFEDGKGTTGARGLKGIRFSADVQEEREKAAREALRRINARYGLNDEE